MYYIYTLWSYNLVSFTVSFAVSLTRLTLTTFFFHHFELSLCQGPIYNGTSTWIAIISKPFSHFLFTKSPKLLMKLNEILDENFFFRKLLVMSGYCILRTFWWQEKSTAMLKILQSATLELVHLGICYHWKMGLLWRKPCKSARFTDFATSEVRRIQDRLQ